ncbi:MAG: 3-deoxy-D-manno-octulosonic acid transferase [Bacteroidota bacterium]|jgi:3-deoxy-D-manno-octulosonic-acid transferase
MPHKPEQMLFLYNLLVHCVAALLPLPALFSRKLQLFVQGRKTVWATLDEKLQPSDKTLWFHAASLGEYEQGLPVIEDLKKKYPQHKIVVTFFSPSGYEVRKNNTVADVTVYLPLDTASNAERFIARIQPDLVFFIKYEYWPNYLNTLKTKAIPTYLISGIFRPNQVFFKSYGGFYRSALKAFDHFFVQNETSKKLLHQLGYSNSTVSGDTRFDRVLGIVERDNQLDFIADFKNNQTTVVAGSTWPKDEELLISYINQAADAVKFIIAPHNIKSEQIASLQQRLQKPTVLFSEKESKDLSAFSVFIIDTIGILTKIYSYADIAYVGGGFGHPGVHNVLEPATFGIPIIVGPHYSHFAEATALVELTGCVSIQNANACKEALDRWIQNEEERFEKGHICATFVHMNGGATSSIITYITNTHEL